MLADMMTKRRLARFLAFDLLWLNGGDLRALPLLARKERLKRLLPFAIAGSSTFDHTRGGGRRLFELACTLDLEGIVAKRADSLYTENDSDRHWIKIKNPAYSQKEGRSDLFKRAG